VALPARLAEANYFSANWLPLLSEPATATTASTGKCFGSVFAQSDTAVVRS